jgi:hypothetical protein
MSPSMMPPAPMMTSSMLMSPVMISMMVMVVPIAITRLIIKPKSVINARTNPNLNLLIIIVIFFIFFLIPLLIRLKRTHPVKQREGRKKYCSQKNKERKALFHKRTPLSNNLLVAKIKKI